MEQTNFMAVRPLDDKPQAEALLDVTLAMSERDRQALLIYLQGVKLGQLLAPDGPRQAG